MLIIKAMPLDFSYSQLPSLPDSSLPSETGTPSIPQQSPLPADLSAFAHVLLAALKNHLSNPTSTSGGPPPLPQPSSPSPLPSALAANMRELQAEFREARRANQGEIERQRKAVEKRLDDLAGAMHSDMRRLNDRLGAEMTTTSSDVFRTAMTVSALQDRVQHLETALLTMAPVLQHYLQGQSSPPNAPLSAEPTRQAPELAETARA